MVWSDLLFKIIAQKINHWCTQKLNWEESTNWITNTLDSDVDIISILYKSNIVNDNDEDGDNEDDKVFIPEIECFSVQ